MASLGVESLPMLERAFLRAVSVGNQVEADRLKKQIIEIQTAALPGPVELNSGQYFGVEPDPTYPFLNWPLGKL